MTAHTRLAKPLVESLRKALTSERAARRNPGLRPRRTRASAAEFLAQVAAKRRRGELALAVESTGGEAGRRRMQIGIVNDDMPFLVNSVANAIAARQLPSTACSTRSSASAEAPADCSRRSSRCATTTTAANR